MPNGRNGKTGRKERMGKRIKLLTIANRFSEKIIAPSVQAKEEAFLDGLKDDDDLLVLWLLLCRQSHIAIFGKDIDDGEVERIKSIFKERVADPAYS